MRQALWTRNFLLIPSQITSLFGNFILKLALSMYILEAAGSAAVFAGILSLSAILLAPLLPAGMSVYTLGMSEGDFFGKMERKYSSLKK